MNTIETVKESTFTPQEYLLTKEMEHLKRLSTLTSIRPLTYEEYYRKSAEYSITKPYIEAGFRFFITGKSIVKFPYSASLGKENTYLIDNKKNKEVTTTNVHGEKYEKILYAGDIPEFALDRLELFNKVWDSIYNIPLVNSNIVHYTRSPAITIHSMSPLPIITERVKIRDIPKVDPVLVGWLKDPRLVFDKGKTQLWGEDSQSLGIVLAVWDNDKELEI